VDFRAGFCDRFDDCLVAGNILGDVADDGEGCHHAEWFCPGGVGRLRRAAWPCPQQCRQHEHGGPPTCRGPYRCHPSSIRAGAAWFHVTVLQISCSKLVDPIEDVNVLAIDLHKQEAAWAR